MYRRGSQALQLKLRPLFPPSLTLPSLAHPPLPSSLPPPATSLQQNIDSLETAAGLPPDMIVAAHGNMDSASCIDTGAPVPVDEVRKALLLQHGSGQHGMDALRAKYGGLVKPDIVFFGEAMPSRFFQLMDRDFNSDKRDNRDNRDVDYLSSDAQACPPEKAELLIVAGTSLAVHPFASLIDAGPASMPRVLVNRERVGENASSVFDPSANGFDFRGGGRDHFVQDDTDDAFTAIAALLGWEEELQELVRAGNAAHENRTATATACSKEASVSKEAHLRIKQVYASTDSAQLQTAYNEWAPTYDDDLRTLGYIGPQLVAETLASLLDPTTVQESGLPVLDAGAGTGLGGPCLLEAGFRDVHALDMSEQMLAVAAATGVYADLTKGELGKPLSLATDAFAAVVSQGLRRVTHRRRVWMNWYV